MAEKLPTTNTMAVPSEDTSRTTSTFSLSVEKPSRPVSSDLEAVKEIPEEWTPQKQEYLVMLTLSIISLMVALDATILVTVLPVSSVPATLIPQ
jgi:hypothetical protein